MSFFSSFPPIFGSCVCAQCAGPQEQRTISGNSEENSVYRLRMHC
jgi:hypothetical protein